jgi:VWFA-related protein
MKLPKLLLCFAAFALVAGAQTSRTLCLFFDLNAMTAADQTRAQDSAIKFVQEQMTAADVVSIMTYTSDVRVIQDFTGDRDKLIAALRRIVPGPDAAAAADENSRLQAIESASAMLAPVAGKKAMIYFSAGALRTGALNQDRLTAALNAAVRANVAIYSVDSRGLGTVSLPQR